MIATIKVRVRYDNSFLNAGLTTGKPYPTLITLNNNKCNGFTVRLDSDNIRSELLVYGFSVIVSRVIFLSYIVTAANVQWYELRNSCRITYVSKIPLLYYGLRVLVKSGDLRGYKTVWY